jgi:1-deoxy-D-xylulose-5-phosphate synthase
MDRVKEAVKHMTLIGGRTGGVFEELGFTYIGPVDGHDLRKLIPSLEMALAAKGPVLFHVGTTKGKGYAPSEKNPVHFHGVGPFDPETGEALSSKVTNTKVFSNALVESAERDARVVAITAAMPDGTGLAEFSRRFPRRYYDVGICEGHAVTLAAGLAAAGLRPVVAIYSTFIQRAYDQVIHDICLQKLPVTIVLDRAGLVGEDGPTHHGAFDLASMRVIPNITILAPADTGEIAPMLEAALNHDGPIVIRYPRGAAKQSECSEITIGQAQVRRKGDELLILAVGHMVDCAEDAAAMLAEHGISATVVNVRTVVPFDPSLLELAKSHRAVLTLEEGVPGGFGTAFLEKLAESGIMVPFKAVTLPADFVEHGPVDALREIHGLTPSAVCEKALALLPSRTNV